MMEDCLFPHYCHWTCTKGDTSKLQEKKRARKIEKMYSMKKYVMYYICRFLPIFAEERNKLVPVGTGTIPKNKNEKTTTVVS